MKSYRLLMAVYVFLSLLCYCGCATIFSGTKDKVDLNSTPKGSTVYIKTESGDVVETVTTPVVIDLPRKKDYVVDFELEGYQSEERKIVRKFNSVSILSYSLYVIPGLCDLATGAHWNLNPDVIHVSLQKDIAEGRLVDITQNDSIRNGFAKDDRKALREDINELKELLKQQTEQKKETKKETSLSMPPKIWLFSVGISEFKKTDLNLSYASIDAENIYNFFRSDSGGRLHKTQAIFLKNSAAKRAEVIKSLTRMVKQASEKDLVIIFFATHGMPDADTGEINFLMYDTILDNLIATGLSHSDLKRIIQRSRAKKVLFIVDACHSGGLGTGTLLAKRCIEISETNLCSLEIALNAG